MLNRLTAAGLPLSDSLLFLLLGDLNEGLTGNVIVEQVRFNIDQVERLNRGLRPLVLVVLSTTDCFSD